MRQSMNDVYINCLGFPRYTTARGVYVFFFQAEDGIRDLVRSRGLGDVYKRQQQKRARWRGSADAYSEGGPPKAGLSAACTGIRLALSLIHI